MSSANRYVLSDERVKPRTTDYIYPFAATCSPAPGLRQAETEKQDWHTNPEALQTSCTLQTREMIGTIKEMEHTLFAFLFHTLRRNRRIYFPPLSLSLTRIHLFYFHLPQPMCFYVLQPSDIFHCRQARHT